MILDTFTLVHVLLSLVGIGAGFIVVYGLLTSNRYDRWTATFLATTTATSVTGFFFPVHHFMPSHGVGIVSLILLGFAITARYRRGLAGSWRKIYAVTSVLALHLNFFVLVVQSFMKVPWLKALAPTQTEPPFAITQLIVLLTFITLAVLAAKKFRSEPLQSF